MLIYFTSDTHFQHAAILDYCSRPWSTVEEMNEGLIQNWNSVVGPNDIVYHLGDFAMGDRSKVPEILGRLNGRIVLIRGNHDHKRSLECFSEVHSRLVVEVEGHKVELAHNPGHLLQDCDFSFCGHVHQAWCKREVGETIEADETEDHSYRHPKIVPRVSIYNVGVDVRGFRPVSLVEILTASH